MKTRKLLDYRKLAFNFHFAAFFVLSIVTLIPLAYTFRLSLFDYQLSKPGSLNIFIGLKNYKVLFTDPGFYKSLGITLIYVISSVSLEMVVGIILSLILHQIPFLRRMFSSMILVPMLIAPLVIGLIFSFFTNPQFGLYTHLVTKFKLPLPIVLLDKPVKALVTLIIMDVWQWAPYMTLIFLAGLQSIEGEYFEAADIDGCNGWQKFWKITMPLLKPIISVSVLLRAMEALKEFDKPYIYSGGGPGNATEVIDLYTYRQAFSSFKFSYASALCVVLFVLLLILGRIYQKFMMNKDL